MGMSGPEGWAAVWAYVDSHTAGWGRRAGQAEVTGVASGWIHVRVAERPRQRYEVQIPCHAWWAAHQPALARWLVWRPDWAAALLAQTWAEDWLSALAAAGLSLFPDGAAVQRMLAGAVCSCPAPERPCRHVLLALATLARMAETSVHCALRWVGIEVETLLDAAHAQTAAWLQEQAAGGQGPALPPAAPQPLAESMERLACAAVLAHAAGTGSLPAAGAGSRPAGALPAAWVPALDTALWLEWRERHITWTCTDSCGGEGGADG
ncbi:MAG: hypothetical protein K6T31_08020 [Alicyclobacillus sp.]|nr:hypothetical protein [Alicyclobacillus sp.]